MLVVHVSLEGRTRPVSCRTNTNDHEIDDALLVDVDGRLRVGRVSRVPIDLPWPKSVKIARVVRPARDEEREQEAKRHEGSQEWVNVAQERADALGLDMRFLRAEAAPSGKKISLTFVAEGRVDFRQLVRDLAGELGARVELRQIGVRDATVLQGGMGHCGRPLCCGTWLPGFAPVSMKMAKTQGLPLNPTKISGQCGRLMCCLRYEIDDSGDGRGKKRRRVPSPGKPGGGRGRVRGRSGGEKGGEKTRSRHELPSLGDQAAAESAGLCEGCCPVKSFQLSSEG